MKMKSHLKNGAMGALYGGLAALMLYLVLSIALSMISPSVYAASVFGDATFGPVPSEREDDTPLAPGDIKHFRAYLVPEEGGERIYVDVLGSDDDTIPYTVGEDEWTFSYGAEVFTATGTYTLCVSTVDSFNQESDLCASPLPIDFVVPKPKGPENLTNTFSITVAQ